MLKISTDQITETGTVTELISTATAKSYLRVDISDDDTKIGSMVTAARIYCENFTGRSFATHTYRADIPNFHDEMVLPGRPIQSISSVQYYNTASPEALTAVAANVYQLAQSSVVRRYGMTWPTSWAIRPDACQITYTSGYLDNASPQVAWLPEPVEHAQLLIIGDLYENREQQFVGFQQVQPNRTVDMLLNAYRVYQ